MKILLSLLLFIITCSSISAQDESYSGDTTAQRQCREAGALDSVRFVHSHSALLTAGHILLPWEAAESLSHNPQHQPQDPLLILQLLCQSEEVAPVDQVGAIQIAYDAWKADTIFVFNICDHVSGTWGYVWCAGRQADSFGKLYDSTITALSHRLNQTAAKQLSAASDASSAFINSRVANEEGFGGSAYSGLCIEAAMGEMGEFLNLVNRVRQSTKPSDWYASSQADSILNAVYLQTLARLGNEEPYWHSGFPTSDGIRDTENLWLIYRNATAALFHSLQPKVSMTQWQNWLTERRIEQLRQINDLPEGY